MTKEIFLSFKKVYLELCILLEHKKNTMKPEEYKESKDKLEESWKIINAKYAENNTKKTDW